MKIAAKNFRSIVFTMVFVFTITGILFNTAVSRENDNKPLEISYNEICDTCYIVYVWIEGVRWAQVYNSDGSMIDFYADPEE